MGIANIKRTPAPEQDCVCSGVPLTDEQFQEEMAERRVKLHLTKNDVVIGCPLCMVLPPPARTTSTGGPQ